MAQALYFDGRSAQEQPATLAFGDAELAIIGDDGVRLSGWPYRRMRSVHGAAAGARWFSCLDDPDARLHVLDDAVAARLKGAASHLFERAGFWSAVAVPAAVFAGLSAAVLAGLYVGIPRLAGPVTELIPPAYDARAGAQVRDMLGRFWPQCESNAYETGREAAERLAVRFAAAAGYEGDVSVGFVEASFPNAFALPGGYILFTDDIIREMEGPDEFAGVLAHETGHVIERHSMKAMVASIGLTLVGDVVLGGAGTSQWVSSLGQEAAALSYSRDYETAADDIALEILRAEAIDPAGFARLFARLEARAEEKGYGDWPEFMSSHPETSRRIEAADAAATYAAAPAMSEDDWAAIKAACGAGDGEDDGPDAN